MMPPVAIYVAIARYIFFVSLALCISCIYAIQQFSINLAPYSYSYSYSYILDLFNIGNFKGGLPAATWIMLNVKLSVFAVYIATYIYSG